MSAKTVSPWGGETKEMSSAHVRPLNLKSMYCNGDTGCSISSTDLGLVDFDNGSSIACLTLLRQMGFWQEGSNLSVNQSKVCRMVEHPVGSISSGQSHKNPDSWNSSAEGFGNQDSPFYGIGQKLPNASAEGFGESRFSKNMDSSHGEY